MKTFIDANKKHFVTRISKWIKIHEYFNSFENVRKNNCLYDYLQDEYGYKINHEKFNKTGYVYCNYFNYNGYKWALDRFYSLNCYFISSPVEYVENGETKYLSGVDMDGNIFNPLYIELSDGGEYVRLYELDNYKNENEWKYNLYD